jgi:hypothetical protein
VVKPRRLSFIALGLVLVIEVGDRSTGTSEISLPSSSTGISGKAIAF